MIEKKKKIMLVEDDIFIRDIYETKLKQEQFEVLMLDNGRDALEKVEEFSPDIILLDIVMPHMDGMDFLREFAKNEKQKNVPIIILSNLSDKERVSQALSMGAKDYLIKSHFTPSEVVGKVNMLLRK